jgi:hypothetical protein
VPAKLDTGAGEVVLDLTRVHDLPALDGRALDIDVDLGRIEVILPPGVGAHIDASVDGGGQIDAFGSHRDGFDNQLTVTHDGGVGAPVIDLDLNVGFGEIDVHEGGAA